MTKHQFTPEGVCAKKIYFELEDGVIRRLRFRGGCSGNLQGLSKLALGRPAAEVAGTLAGLRCGTKETSCPDQLARALLRALARSAKKSPAGC